MRDLVTPVARIRLRVALDNLRAALAANLAGVAHARTDEEQYALNNASGCIKAAIEPLEHLTKVDIAWNPYKTHTKAEDFPFA